MSEERDVQVTGDGNVVGEGNTSQVVRAEGGSTIKNVVQAMIHLGVSPWGLAVLSVGLIVAFVSSAVVIIQPQMHPPTPTVTPAPTPTPMAFPPARKGESLIVVADFEDRSEGTYGGIDAAQYVYEKLEARIGEDRANSEEDISNVRVERLRQAVDDNTAEKIGEQYDATLVLWGWYDALTITPRLERIKVETSHQSCEALCRLSLQEDEKVDFSIIITDQLPSQATYLALLILGVDRYDSGDYDEALAYLGSALDAIPTYAYDSINPGEAYFFLGGAYFGKHDYKRAVENYDEAIQHKICCPGAAYYNRGLAYASGGEHDLAIADYDEAIQLQPDNSAAYNNRGLEYGKKGDHDLAMADYNKAIQLEPQDACAYINRGCLYRNEGKYDLAMADYNKAIQLEPDNASAYSNRGTIYSVEGEYDLAMADYNKAIRLEPDKACAYSNRGNHYWRIGEYDRAIADFNKVIQLEPDNASAYSNRGFIYLESGDYDHAIADLGHAIQLQPDAPFAYGSRGRAYEEKGNLDQAIADYSEAIERKPDYAGAYWGRGSAYQKKGDLDRAIADYSKAIQLDPHILCAYMGRGIAYHASGDPERAYLDFDKAIEINPDAASAYNEVAWALVYDLDADYETALEYALRSVELDPDEHNHDTLALVYFKLEQYEKALEHYSTALDFDPEQIGSYKRRADVYLALGDIDAALADYQTYVSLAPPGPERGEVEKKVKSLQER